MIATPPSAVCCTEIESPLGPVVIAGHRAGVVRVAFQKSSHPLHIEPTWSRPRRPRTDPILGTAVQQLTEYFRGERRAFELELALRGTSFQLAVWHALCRIPYGSVASYGEVAEAVGNPRAFRAVGMANGKNPLAIVVPCHRVIDKTGTLGGYTGGLHFKRGLLALEGYLVD